MFGIVKNTIEIIKLLSDYSSNTSTRPTQSIINQDTASDSDSKQIRRKFKKTLLNFSTDCGTSPKKRPLLPRLTSETEIDTPPSKKSKKHILQLDTDTDAPLPPIDLSSCDQFSESTLSPSFPSDDDSDSPSPIIYS